MPEGDTVHLAADRLDAALGGEVLTRTDFRVPRFATRDLAGQQVNEVVARGKHLLLRTDTDTTLHTHFKMEGAWHIYRHNDRWRGPTHQIRAVLETASVVAVGFRLGICELLPTSEEERVVGHLGPDPLGPDWDQDIAVAALSRDPTRSVGDALGDQTVIAGPGNIYRCEALFLAGLDPDTAVGDVERPNDLVALIAKLMVANRSTGMQITTGDARPGRTHWVYGRFREPCRRCGTPIARNPGTPGVERVTYWCPTCQPALR
ncbi:MAG TPA: DNA-formamidopyrimidine glycosylase family protein [Actinomycetota bacterium]|nr:DNA-formamidopyrimidine glycosylase family protein [Actinomycetota bacterium]